MTQRALVTGAAGFVGANLVRRLLRDGLDVRAAHRPGGEAPRLDGIDVERLELELWDPDSCRRTVERVRPDVIFHLAAHGAYSWQQDAERIVGANVLGTVNLLDACAAAGFEAFVHAGSSSEYGVKDHAPTEDERLEPNSLYAVAKAAATHACSLRGRGGLPVVTLRLYSVYGPFEDERRLVPTLLRHALGGTLPPLVSPTTARDFVFVEDASDAFVRAAANADGHAGEVFNVASGAQTTIGELVELVRGLFSVTAEPSWGSFESRRWDTDTWVGDPAKIRRELGWAARTTLEDGLRATAAHLQEQPA